MRNPKCFEEWIFHNVKKVIVSVLPTDGNRFKYPFISRKNLIISSQRFINNHDLIVRKYVRC